MSRSPHRHRQGHRQLDHTADLALEVWAPDEPALLEEAARALCSIMTDGALPGPDAVRTVSLDQCFDREDRLVRFLNEVIFLAVNEEFVVHAARFDLRGETDLIAELSGGAAPLAGELKSVTYHDLSLEQGEGGWRAVFVVDV